MLVSEGYATAGAMLIIMPCAATGTVMTSRPELLPRAISEPMALPQPGSLSIYMAPGTIEGHADDRGLSCHLGQCWLSLIHI